MSNDFYCEQILTGKIDIKKVFETENVLAYHHTNPSWPLHIVIIPKFHTESLLTLRKDCDNQIVIEMMQVLEKVIQEVVEENGSCRLTTNFGSSQNTKHLHWHVYVTEDII